MEIDTIMICAVYKSLKKADTYLFVNKKGQFDDVPAPLMQVFGPPQLVMLLPLQKGSNWYRRYQQGQSRTGGKGLLFAIAATAGGYAEGAETQQGHG